MIICIEGPRNTGKSFLLRHYLDSNLRLPSVEAFKFKMVEYVQLLPELQKIEDTAAFHYFNLSPFFTILELQRSGLGGTTLMSDRGLISGYVWSIIRKRITLSTAEQEIESIIKSDLYSSCHIIQVEKSPTTVHKKSPVKDFWSAYENYEQEVELFNYFSKILESEKINKNSTFTRIYNHFNEKSIANFSELVNKIITNGTAR